MHSFEHNVVDVVVLVEVLVVDVVVDVVLLVEVGAVLLVVVVVVVVVVPSLGGSILLGKQKPPAHNFPAGQLASELQSKQMSESKLPHILKLLPTHPLWPQNEHSFKQVCIVVVVCPGICRLPNLISDKLFADTITILLFCVVNCQPEGTFSDTTYWPAAMQSDIATPPLPVILLNTTGPETVKKNPGNVASPCSQMPLPFASSNLNIFRKPHETVGGTMFTTALLVHSGLPPDAPMALHCS